MGKRIPGKKHHGIKDPEKQKQRRDALLKQKVNIKSHICLRVCKRFFGKQQIFA
jgi:hypothetical protein